MTHNDLRYEFGPYQLNPSKRILTRDGEGIPLTPKATEILLVLVNTGDVELDYLADGLTHNVINNLSRLSQLRVMSHSAAFRYKTREYDPQRVGKELRAAAVLVANIDTRRNGIAVNLELVDVAGGWQLWGETFDSESKDLLEIQESITRDLLVALKLRLTGAEEKKITARYTENPAAYQAYLEGRYHWSRHTREGIKKAISHFRLALKLDPNYALAYAAVVDCYLRLTTNYLPPEEDGSAIARLADNESDQIELRFEWDWRSVERELRRAADLKTDYTSSHQWYFVYRISKQLYEESFSAARKWPKLASLNPYAAADLLFTLGTLCGSVAGSTQVVHGHKQAEAFLNGSIALFAQLGLASRSSEARIELARCYYKQGLFDLGRETLSEALSELPDDQIEIKSFGLLVWGAIERDSGRLQDSLIKLREAASLEGAGPLAAGRCYHELATTLKELDRDGRYSDEAALHFQRALYKFEAVGHHRFVAAIENNLGFLLLSVEMLKESEQHLLRSKRLFDSLADSVHGAQTTRLSLAFTSRQNSLRMQKKPSIAR